jgi:hypothetical protein
VIQRVLAVVSALLLLLTLSSDALAQKKPPREKETPEQQQAKALFEEGITLSDAGKWPDALAAFQRSDELAPSPTVRFNIGATLRALGRYVEAKNTLDAILTQAAAQKPPPKPAFVDDVRKLLGEVLQKIVVIEIQVTPRTAELEVDGAEPQRLPDGKLELDPGKHVFVARADGHETITIARNLTADDVELAITLTPIKSNVVEKRVEVRVKEEETPFYKRFWFWTAAGAVVAGAVVVTVVVATRPDAREPAGPPSSTVDRVTPVAIRF